MASRRRIRALLIRILLRRLGSGWSGARVEEYNELVSRLVRCLRDSGLDYALTGALAVSFYGSPRTTSDVDVMVAIAAKEDVKRRVIEVLQCAGLEVDERKIENALTSGYSIANFKDKATPYSVDIIFATEKFDKQFGEVAGLTCYLQKPEGLIAAKLRMIKATVPKERALKDIEDVKAVLAFTKVNLGRVRRQAKKEKTSEILESIIEESAADSSK
jgi:hypothetical protein